jgi:hypothetical protein
MTAVSKVSVLNNFSLRIQVVNDNVSVALVTCCKHDNLEILGQLLYALPGIWPHIDTSLQNSSIWKLNW